MIKNFSSFLKSLSIKELPQHSFILNNQKKNQVKLKLYDVGLRPNKHIFVCYLAPPMTNFGQHEGTTSLNATYRFSV